MSGKVYFITGGNRGIGFQLVKQFSADPSNTVIASVRTPSTATELFSLSQTNENIKVVELDVSSKDSIAKLSQQLQVAVPDGIDTFISNSGIADPVTTKPVIDATEWDVWIRHYQTNTLGAIFVTQAVYPFLLKKKTRQIAFVSSSVGSLSRFIPFTTSAYGQSKAALNHSVLSLAAELVSDGFTTIALHPGVVMTEMTKATSEIFAAQDPASVQYLASIAISPEESGEAIFKVINKLNSEDNGKFYSYDGTEVLY